jgi:hypothetical protein
MSYVPERKVVLKGFWSQNDPRGLGFFFILFVSILHRIHKKNFQSIDLQMFSSPMYSPNINCTVTTGLNNYN